MSDSTGGEGSDGPRPLPRKVRTRQPTLIGIATAKPTPIEAPKAEAAPPKKPPPEAKKPLPAPSESGVSAKPAFPTRPTGGVPPRHRPFPPRPRSAPPPPPPERTTDPDPAVAPALSAEELASQPTKLLPSAPPPPPEPDIALEPTLAAVDGVAVRSLVDEWAPAAPPAEDEGAPPLAAEITQVTDEPEAIHTDPGLEVPFEGELAAEATRPVVPAPLDSPPGDDDAGPVSVPDLVPVSTVIVDQASLAQPAQVYTMDLESGYVAMQTDEPIEIPGRKVPIGLIVGGLVAALVIVGVGIGVGFVLMSGGSREEPVDGPTGAAPGGQAVEDPVAAPSEEPPAPEEAAPAAPTEAAPPPPSEAVAEAPADAEGEDHGEDAMPAPAGGAASIEEIEAFDLPLPRVSRRARRLSDAERLSQGGRHRARGLSAYREQRWDDAVRELTAALEHNDWDVAAMEGLARTRARQGQFPEAVAWAELAVRRNSRSAATHRILGDVWRQAGHDDRALAAWRRGLRRHPEDRWLRMRIRELSE